MGVFRQKVCSGFNTDYGSSEPLKTLIMLCEGGQTKTTLDETFQTKNPRHTPNKTPRELHKPHVPFARTSTMQSRCDMKISPAWSTVRKTSNINIDGPASPTFVASSDISINGNRNGNDIFTEMESKNGNELEMELE